MSNLVSRLSLGRLVRVGTAAGMGQDTAIAEREPGREGVTHRRRSPRAGANGTRVPCAGCGARACACRLTWRRGWPENRHRDGWERELTGFALYLG
jgi:hypothetical protein